MDSNNNRLAYMQYFRDMKYFFVFLGATLATGIAGRVGYETAMARARQYEEAYRIQKIATQEAFNLGFEFGKLSSKPESIICGIDKESDNVDIYIKTKGGDVIPMPDSEITVVPKPEEEMPKTVDDLVDGLLGI